ncbi:hypothetical protein LINPERHAP1_LOCUS20949 [Linum perenne]
MIQVTATTGTTTVVKESHPSQLQTAAADRHHNRNSRSPPSKFSNGSRNSDVLLHQFKKPNPRTGGGADEGIEAVGKKTIFNFKTEVDKMKFEFLRKKFCDEDGDEDEEEDAEEQYE